MVKCKGFHNGGSKAGHASHAGSASAERVGQGEVGGITRRVTCTWWLLGLVVKVSWLGQGGPTLSKAAWTGLLPSPFKGLTSGREGCLGSE